MTERLLTRAIRMAALAAYAMGLSQPAHGFDRPVHARITAALSFIKPDTLAIITDENMARDHWWFLWRKADKWHFNDCDFAGASANIQATYERVLSELNGSADRSPDPAAAAAAFGQLLHVVQDIYSHSNWVELQQPGRGACDVSTPAQPELIDRGYGNWPAMTPWSLIGDVVVIQDAPRGMAKARGLNPDSLRWCSESKKASVETTDGVPRRALVSGKVLYLDGYALPLWNKCPRAVGALHWDRYCGANELHKDSFGQHYHDRAVELATQQTRHEWCRLLALAHHTDPREGIRRVLATWVDDRTAAARACVNDRPDDILEGFPADVRNDLITSPSNAVARSSTPLFP